MVIVNEVLMREALTACDSGQYTNLRECARDFGLAESTLRSRLNGSQPHRIAHEHRQLLSNTQEDYLVEWSLELER